MLETAFDESSLTCPIVLVSALKILHQAVRVIIQRLYLICCADLKLVLGALPWEMEDVTHLPTVETALQWKERGAGMGVRVICKDASPIMASCQTVGVDATARVLHVEDIFHAVHIRCTC